MGESTGEKEKEGVTRKEGGRNRERMSETSSGSEFEREGCGGLALKWKPI